MGKFYYVPEKKLKHVGGSSKRGDKASEGGGWKDSVQAFEGTKFFARAKFFASLLKNQGLVPDELDVLRLKDATCSATILLRNLVSPKTVVSRDTARFLKRLRERGAPEAISISSSVVRQTESTTSRFRFRSYSSVSRKSVAKRRSAN